MSAREALRLEARAQDCPDERDWLLLCAAAEWRIDGNVGRSIVLLREVAAGGGRYAASARVELVTTLVDAGRDVEARAELATLTADPTLDTDSCSALADLLHSRGERAEALVWYDRYLDALTGARLAAVAAQDLRSVIDTAVLRCRRRVREELGLPEDGTDALVPPGPWPRDGA